MVLIHEYAKAAVELYGVIDIASFVKIFNKFIWETPEPFEKRFQPFLTKTTEKEVRNALAIRSEMGIDVQIWNNYLASRLLNTDGFQEAKTLIANMTTLDYSVPAKSKFLSYRSGEYVENTPEYTSMMDFLKKAADPAFFQDQFDMMIAMTMTPKYNLHWQEIAEDGAPLWANCLKKKDRNTFVELYIDALYSQPCWLYRGLSRKEYYKQYEKVDKKKSDILWIKKALA